MIRKIENEYADIWLVCEDSDGLRTYCYGGTRSVSVETDDRIAEEMLNYLGKYESGIKNKLINRAIDEGVFDRYSDRLPRQFFHSNVGGGRCVFRAKNKEIEEIVNNPKDDMFDTVIDSILRTVGEQLEELGGMLKLTPDFGRYAGVADILYRYTDHVLGIRCENGGCGGKASYTSTGINAAIDYVLSQRGNEQKIVLIGSAGACGIGVFDYLIEKNYNLVGVCDLDYTHEIEREIPVLAAQEGVFTEECLAEADIIVATTVGNEFINSNVDVIKDGATVLLAHNNCLPVDTTSVKLIDKLAKRNITVVPGQFLTYGGALTSRIEWFWRQFNKGKYFDKQLAHEAVYHMEFQLMDKLYSKHDINPFELILLEQI